MALVSAHKRSGFFSRKSAECAVVCAILRKRSDRRFFVSISVSLFFQRAEKRSKLRFFLNRSLGPFNFWENVALILFRFDFGLILISLRFDFGLILISLWLLNPCRSVAVLWPFCFDFIAVLMLFWFGSHVGLLWLFYNSNTTLTPHLIAVFGIAMLAPVHVFSKRKRRKIFGPIMFF